MFVLGHVGVTVAGARLAGGKADLRLAALLSLLPDIIDKPLRELMPVLVSRNTRSFGHSFLGAAAVLLVLLALRRRRGDAALLWACFAGHLVLDLMWLGEGPATLLWPLLGPFPPPSRELELMRPVWMYNVAGEALGLGLLLAAAHDTNR